MANSRDLRGLYFISVAKFQAAADSMTTCAYLVLVLAGNSDLRRPTSADKEACISCCKGDIWSIFKVATTLAVLVVAPGYDRARVGQNSIYLDLARTNTFEK